MDKHLSFNLVDEPWILAKDLDGNVREFSLLELFSEAPQLQCLANDLPTQDFAILRVLLAILQRSIDPIMDDDSDPAEVWGGLWSAETLPMDNIASYLEQWRNRFDLFDSKRPFMQVASLHGLGKSDDFYKEKDSKNYLQKIIADVPDRQERMLFTMKCGLGAEQVTFSEAARWLIHAHAFDTGGNKSGTEGDPSVKGGKINAGKVGWAGRIGALYVEGATLQQTLLLNFISANVDDETRIFSDEDIPAWEQAPKKADDSHDLQRLPFGRADLYSWQSRRIRLIPEGGSVINLILTHGDALNMEPEFLRLYEPMTVWRLDKGGKGYQPQIVAMCHNPSKAFWRGLNSVFGIESSDTRPGILNWIDYLKGNYILSSEQVLCIHAVGLEYKSSFNSNVTELIDDTLKTNLYLLSSEGTPLVNLACECVEWTDKAIAALGRLAGNLCQASGGHKELAGGARERAKSEAYYEIDSVFRSWFARLGPQSDPSEVRLEWCNLARTVLKGIASKLMEEASPNAIVGTAIKDSKGKVFWMTAAKAEALFRKALYEALPDNNVKPNEKED